jgi:predicted TPR repeat methyltransferase
MLVKAGEKAIYDHLAQADLSLSAEACGLFADGLALGRADLVTAADVLMYLGNLDTVCTLAAALLSSTGVFAFSVEDAGENQGFVLQPSLRYAHSKTYVEATLQAHGFEVLESTRTGIRKDGGKPLFGILFLARKAA